MMLAGFRSRCSTPRSCAGRSPAQIFRANSIALSCGQPADPAEERREVLAVDVLHRQEVQPVDLAEVVDAADVRVRDLPRDPHLVAEPRQRRFGSRSRRRQELERDRSGRGSGRRRGRPRPSRPARDAEDAIAPASTVTAGKRPSSGALEVGADAGRSSSGAPVASAASIASTSRSSMASPTQAPLTNPCRSRAGCSSAASKIARTRANRSGVSVPVLDARVPASPSVIRGAPSQGGT